MEKMPISNFKLKNGQTVSIRSLIPTDAQSLLDFRKQIAEESTFTLNYIGMPLPSAAETEKRLSDQANNASIFNIAAFSQDKLVAYLNLRPFYQEHPWVQHIAQFGMMILKDFWGQGLGKHLLELQDAFAKEQNFHRIEALVRADNQRGIRLYTSSGFKIEGTKECGAKINNEYQDEYFIAKILN